MSIRKQYDSDLEALRVALVEMGQNAAEAVENALEALCTADTAAAQKIVQGDDRINNMERDIEHRCMTLLLRQQPVAGDLRHISTAMKVVTDIERMGDHASDIAEIIPHLVTVRKEGDPAVSQAIAMGRKAYQMILDAMDALTAEDEIAARRVIAADDAVDYDCIRQVSESFWIGYRHILQPMHTDWQNLMDSAYLNIPIPVWESILNGERRYLIMAKMK